MATAIPAPADAKAAPQAKAPARSGERGSRSRFMPSFTGMVEVHRQVVHSTLFIRLLVIMASIMALIFTVLVVFLLYGLHNLLPRIQEHEKIAVDPMSASVALPASLLDEGQFSSALATFPQRTGELYSARARAYVDGTQYPLALVDFARAERELPAGLQPRDAIVKAETLLKLYQPGAALKYLLALDLHAFTADEHAQAISLIGQSQLALDLLARQSADEKCRCAPGIPAQPVR